jgi:hypothetical protein
MNSEPFTGSRICPSLDSVKDAVSFAREKAFQLASMRLPQQLSPEVIELYNFGTLYVLWHQFFSIATRAIRQPYVACELVSEISGISTIADKDSGDGYKTRLIWMRQELLKHMQRWKV